MPAIKLHQPIEGGNVGDTVEVPQARADFYLALGYASAPDQDGPPAVPAADADPTLAANREAPDEDPPTSPDVVPAEAGNVTGSVDAHREAQAKADKESEQVRERSANVRSEVEDGTTTEALEAQAQADEHSEQVGDNAHDQPGDREVPVTDPAEPAIPAVDPGVLEVADGEATPATKGTRPKRVTRS